ncbi:MAG: CHAT domain-containing protein [Pseudomonadota bacterium]|nr:CHAT domain-containing protein [Pseudomonadota bacterium]
MPAEWRFSVEGKSNDLFDMRLDYTGGPYDGLPFRRAFPDETFRIDLDGISAANRRRPMDGFPADRVEIKSQPITLADLEGVGGQLYNALFRGDGSEHFDLAYRMLRNNAAQQVDGAAEDENFLNIWFDSRRAAELGNLPWEVLWDKESGTFLATDKACNIVRRLDPAFPQGAPEPITDKIRVLVATANPQADLDTGTEFANIERQLGELTDGPQKRIEIKALEEANSLNLSDTINSWKPHIVHYIGHGDFRQDTGVISLHKSDDPRRAHSVDSTTFRQMMVNHRPWLVVLNSCLGGVSSRFDPFAGAAQALRQIDVPFVVAMQYSISDDAAIRFSQRLYGELAMGTPIAPAVSSARSAIRELEDPLSQIELITPVLYASSALHRIPLPPLIAAAAIAGGADAAAAEEPPPPGEGAQGGRNWLAIIGTGAGVISAVAAVVALMTGGQEIGVGIEQPQPSPTATPEPQPTGTPDEGGGDATQNAGGVGGYDYGDPVTRSAYSSPPVAYKTCDDGQVVEETQNCPPPYVIYDMGEARDYRDVGDERLNVAASPPPVPVPPPPPPPPPCDFGPFIVFFEFGSSQLDDYAKSALDQAVAAYANCGSAGDIALAGHDDRSGSLAQSLAISEQRNAAVRDYLAQRGISDARISSEAFGESQPRVPTADGVREYQNRRVELMIAAPAIPPQDIAISRAMYGSAKSGLERQIRLLEERLADDAQRRERLLSDAQRAESERVLTQARATLRDNAVLDDGDADVLRAAASRLNAATGRILADRDIHDEASFRFAAQMRQDMRRINQAASSEPELYLEITSPFQTADQEPIAECLGLRLQQSIQFASGVLERQPSQGSIFEFQSEFQLPCRDPASQETLNARGYWLGSRAEWIEEDGPLILTDRVEVKTQQRRFAPPEEGSTVPLGAHREVRLRLEGTEQLAFDSRSAVLQPDARRKISRLAAFLDDYHAKAAQLPPIACEGDEDTQCLNQPEPSLTLVLETAPDPSADEAAEKRLAGARLNAILNEARGLVDGKFTVNAAVCKAPWHVRRDDGDVVEVSIIPDGTELALDICAAQQEFTFQISEPEDD